MHTNTGVKSAAELLKHLKTLLNLLNFEYNFKQHNTTTLVFLFSLLLPGPLILRRLRNNCDLRNNCELLKEAYSGTHLRPHVLEVPCIGGPGASSPLHAGRSPVRAPLVVPLFFLLSLLPLTLLPHYFSVGLRPTLTRPLLLPLPQIVGPLLFSFPLFL